MNRQLILLMLGIFLTAKMTFGQDLAVKFNHQIHAEEYKISCRYCHYYSDRSEHAGIPSLYDCLGCHQVVKGTTEERQFEIRKLEHLRLFKQDLIWTRVNDLPDFVFFSHRSHTLKGFECEECHGEVADSTAPDSSGKIEELTMQWCMDCHVKKYLVDAEGKPNILSEPDAIENESIKEKIVRGTTECQTCHK